MQYISTRNHKHIVNSAQAIINGLADHGGLYVPKQFPKPIDLKTCQNDTYQQLACKILYTFFDDLSFDAIQQAVDQAYTKHFSSSHVVPVTKTDDGYLMELYHGPTCAFKDIALTILPHLLTSSYQQLNHHKNIAILTATSGDTGKAALSGFQDVEHTNIAVLYPHIGVSSIQKRQMQVAQGKNVQVFGIQGNFDDCQRLVKQLSSDPAFLQQLKNHTVSSANSINIGRLIPQIVYYFSTYFQLVQQKEIQLGESVQFSVPTGNFGDVLAGYYAYKLGLPIHKLIVASNQNHVLADFIQTGTYDIRRPFYTTTSPSMDILISSNLERLLFDLCQDDQEVCRYMHDLQTKKTFTVSAQLLSKIQKIFTGVWVDEQTCADQIHTLFHQQHCLIDPHTAIAYAGFKKVANINDPKTIVLSTASPYKFVHDVLKALTHSSQIMDDQKAIQQLEQYTNTTAPSQLTSIFDLPLRFMDTLEVEQVKQAILNYFNGETQ